MMTEDSKFMEMLQRAKLQILPEVLSLSPELPVVDLSKKVYSFILEIVDKMVRPTRHQECELLMVLEDVFAGLNNELISNNIDYTEFRFNIEENTDGPIVDLQIVCMNKVMLQFRLYASELIPMLKKRYAELRMKIEI